MTLGTSKREPIDADTLVKKISAFVRQNPKVSVLIGGDERVDYGKVYQAMVLLQQSGVAKVGLMTSRRRKRNDSGAMESFGDKLRAYVFALLVNVASAAALFAGLFWTKATRR